MSAQGSRLTEDPPRLRFGVKDGSIEVLQPKEIGEREATTLRRCPGN
jgi:hypothetical protein